MAPFDPMFDPALSGMDPMAYVAMSRLQQSLPRINPTRYAEGYEIRRSLRGAFVGPGTHPMGVHRPGLGGQLAQAFGGGPYPSAEQDFNPEAANVLGQYGLHQAQPNPFLFFNDMDSNGEPSWAARHTKVARAIEGAMLGAANTQQGMTTGENITNVARSVLSIPGMYRQSYAAQLQAPFDQARQIASLEAEGTRQQLQDAQAFHLWATGRQAMDKGPKFQPFYDPSQGMIGYNPSDNTYLPSKNLATGAVQTGPVQKPGTPRTATDAKTGLPKGINPGSAAGKAWIKWAQSPQFDGSYPADWGERVDRETSRTAAAGGYGGTSARKAAGQEAGDISKTDETTLNELKSQRDLAAKRWEAADKLKPSDVRGRKEPTFAERLAAERAERKSEYEAKDNAYRDAITNSTQGKRPGAVQITTGVLGKPSTQQTRTTGGTSRPQVTINSDGSISVK